MPSPLVTLAEIKAELGITHDDHDALLTSQEDAAEWATYHYIGQAWHNAVVALPIIKQAIVLYVRALYNGEDLSFVTDPMRSHAYYRLLKPIANSVPPEAPQVYPDDLLAELEDIEKQFAELNRKFDTIDPMAIAMNTIDVAANQQNIQQNSSGLALLTAAVDDNTARTSPLVALFSDATPESEFRIEYYRAAADGTDEGHIYYVFGTRILPFGWFEANFFPRTDIGTDDRPGVGYRLPAQMTFAPNAPDTFTKDVWFPHPTEAEKQVQREVLFTQYTDDQGRQGYFSPAVNGNVMNGSIWSLYRYKVDPWPRG